MRQDDFRRWLEAQDYAKTTITTQLANVRKIEQGYGDLDERYDEDGLAGIAREFAYTAADRKAGRAPLTRLTLWGSPYRDLASLRATLNYYKHFRQGRARMAQDLVDPDRTAVEKAMDECEAVGLPAFLEAYGFSPSNLQYYARRGRALFPTKALYGVAHQYMPGGVVMDNRSLSGTDAHLALASLGYEIIRNPADGEVPAVVTAGPATAARSGPTNTILYGPPGTGKTRRTAFEAVRLCDGSAPADRESLMHRYRELVAQKRIAFVTFHQSMDYETFVEGLRPETEESETAGSGFRLEPRAGLFREVCKLADEARRRTRAPGRPSVDLENRQFWKMSLGAAGVEDDVYEAALAGNYVVLGWGGDVDWSDARFEDRAEVRKEWASKTRDNDSPSNYSQLWRFRASMKKGDIVVVSYGNSAFRAVAEVTGDYQYAPRPGGDYSHRRAVRWLLKLDEALPLETIVQGAFTMRSLYVIPQGRVNKAALQRLLGDTEPGAGALEHPRAGEEPEAFVLIIDEINRANVARVFGELITLIEPDKRLGQPDALEVTLPHSHLPFGVPDNLHILGAMNTADRSIALLDTALRRRFRFVEMPPRPELLEDAAVGTGEPLVLVLRAMNDRVEYLLDRDHCIGHAYLMNCRTRDELDAAFRDRVIPLLQEYFFEDWGKVAAVLGERSEPAGRSSEGSFLRCRRLRDPTGSNGEDRLSWSVRESFAAEAYARLVAGPGIEAFTSAPPPDSEPGDLEAATPL